jgi:hypothetical protein
VYLKLIKSDYLNDLKAKHVSILKEILSQRSKLSSSWFLVFVVGVASGFSFPELFSALTFKTSSHSSTFRAEFS